MTQADLPELVRAVTEAPSPGVVLQLEEEVGEVAKFSGDVYICILVC